MKIAKIDIGFIEFPEHIMLNVYAVGCKKKCKGCHNPELRDFNYKKSYELVDKEFEDKLNKCDGLIDGVCWLGGDAIYQEERLIKLSKLVKSKEKLINCLYTGLNFEDICEDVKKVTDIIVDGEWKGKKVDEKGTNQTIWVKNKKKWEKIEYEDLTSLPKEIPFL